MDKFVSYEKLSKRKQRELSAKQRTTWGAISPVTRKADNGKGYSRKKARDWKDENPSPEPFLLAL